MPINIKRPNERFRFSLPVGGHFVTVTEFVPGDGSPHEFHVTLHSGLVRLTEKPFYYLPLKDDIAALVAAYSAEPSKEVAALVAALRYACQELGAFASGSTEQSAQWALRLQHALLVELDAVQPIPEKGTPPHGTG